MTTHGYPAAPHTNPAPLARARDWRIPALRRFVLALGWLVFAGGIGAGAVGVAAGVAFAWGIPAGSAAVALAALVLAPEPRPVDTKALRRVEVPTPGFDARLGASATWMGAVAGPLCPEIPLRPRR